MGAYKSIRHWFQCKLFNWRLRHDQRYSRLYLALMSIDTALGVLYPTPNKQTIADPKGHLEQARREIKAFLKEKGCSV